MKELIRLYLEIICYLLGHKWIIGEQNGMLIELCARCKKIRKKRLTPELAARMIH